MNDERLDELIDGVRTTYRVPPEPPVDAMWAAIDADLGPAREAGPAVPAVSRPFRSGAPWRAAGLAAAAALVMGVGIGRWSVGAPVTASVPAGDALAAAQASVLAEPLHRTATDYLGETAAMLRQFENDAPGAYAGQATSLLTTTRLLLDSPAGSDARMHELLEDLELILAQISALRGERSTSQALQEIRMIRSALRERDVVPRVHTAAITLASSDD